MSGSRMWKARKSLERVSSSGIRVSSIARNIFLELAAMDGGKGVFPSRRTLADNVGCSVRSVANALNALEEHGLVLRQVRRKADGRQGASQYEMLYEQIPDAALDDAVEGAGLTCGSEETNALTVALAEEETHGPKVRVHSATTDKMVGDQVAPENDCAGGEAYGLSSEVDRAMRSENLVQVDRQSQASVTKIDLDGELNRQGEDGGQWQKAAISAKMGLIWRNPDTDQWCQPSQFQELAPKHILRAFDSS